MVKNQMKKCSPSLAMKEMQVKTTLRFHLTLVRIASIKNTTNKNVGEDVGKREPSYTAGWNLETIWRLLKKLNTDLPYDPAMPLLGIYMQRNVTQVITKAPAHPCLLQCYLKWQSHGNSQDAPLPMNGLKNVALMHN
jgi:hypothetical protein